MLSLWKQWEMLNRLYCLSYICQRTHKHPLPLGIWRIGLWTISFYSFQWKSIRNLKKKFLSENSIKMLVVPKGNHNDYLVKYDLKSPINWVILKDCENFWAECVDIWNELWRCDGSSIGRIGENGGFFKLKFRVEQGHFCMDGWLPLKHLYPWLTC